MSTIYPKILILREDQPHKERWERYFYDQYLSERARLGLSYEPGDSEISVKQGVLELTAMSRTNSNINTSISPVRRDADFSI